MIFHKKNKYDLIMSIGEACFCSQSLRYRNLQRYSYPLDWGFGGNFEKRLSIVKNKFDEHFKKEFLECLDFYDDNRFIVYNKITDFYFNHDFYINKGSWEEQYGYNKAKYDRRIKRVLELLSSRKKKKILLVFIEVPVKKEDGYREYSLEEIQEHVIELEEIFPNNEFHILYIEHKESFFPNRINCEVTSKVKKISLYNRTFNKNEPLWMGNKENVQKALAEANIILKGRNVFEKIGLLLLNLIW